MAFLKHSLGKTFYISKGKGKIPLICLHGGPGSGHRGLLPFLDLAKERRVVIYDQLGCGKSSKTKKNLWTMETFVKELDILVAKLKLDKFYLYGISCGSTLALEYYLSHPEKVQGIIFQSPFFSTKDWTTDALRLVKKMKGKNKKILLKSIAGKKVDEKDFDQATFAYYLKHVLRDKKILTQYWNSTANKSGTEIYEYMWGKSEHYVTGTLKTYERANKLNTIKVPVFVVGGEHDEAAPKTLKKYAKQIPGAKFKVIRGASHAIPAEKPKKLKKEVVKFLAGLE